MVVWDCLGRLVSRRLSRVFPHHYYVKTFPFPEDASNSPEEVSGSGTWNFPSFPSNVESPPSQMLTPSSRAILLSIDVKLGGLGFKIEPLSLPWNAHYFNIPPPSFGYSSRLWDNRRNLAPLWHSVIARGDDDDDPYICFSRAQWCNLISHPTNCWLSVRQGARWERAQW